MFRSAMARRGGLRNPAPHAGPFIDEFCQEHGWHAHVCLHEAAHAVAAIDRGIRVIGLTIFAPEQWARADQRSMTAGGVDLERASSDVSATTKARSLGLEIAVAGSLAERCAYGHNLAGSFEGDLRFWRTRYAVSTAGSEWIDTAIGEPFAVLTERVESWATRNIDRIRLVSAVLYFEIDIDLRRAGPSKTSWSMTGDELARLAE